MCNSETVTLNPQKPTLNTDQTKSCHLSWSNIIKTVEVKDASIGLIRSSIAGNSGNNGVNGTTNAAPTTTTKVILNQISGQAKPGQLMALMGPSGSGKTSLLDVLASRSAYNYGTFYLNGDNMTADASKLKKLKRKIAYIKQKDIFFEHLSVRDQLTYTAFLRLGDDYTKEQKITEVNKVIELLRLEKCADTPIMLVSGGERKRCNIGTELLTNPSIIMLDEPTSGLDSTSAVALMALLRSLAHDHGKTIITSIHQPSSAIFHQFDNVMFLVDGCVVYNGTPSDSLLYTKKTGYACPDGYNAADHWMDLLVDDSAVATIEANIGKDDVENNNDSLTEKFPIRSVLEGEATTKNTFDEETGLNINNNEKGSMKKSLSNKRFGSKLSRKFSSMTMSVKGDGGNATTHLLEMAKRKRNEYIAQDKPKARLITFWDVDKYAQQIEQDMNDLNDTASVHSTGTDDKNQDVLVEKKFNTSWMTQFRVLLHRALKNSSAAIWKPINFFKSIALGLLTGLLWFQTPNDEKHLPDRQAFIFFCITYWIFDGTFTAIFTFPTERDIIFKERASGSYYLSAYFLSKTLSEMPTRLSLPAIFWTLTYWMSGINPRFEIFLGTLGCILLAVLAGESYGLLCGAVVMDFEKGMTIMVVISLTTMAAGGFYISNIPAFLSWVKYTSPFKFGYEASQLLIIDRPVPCDGSGVLAAYCTEGVESVSREDVLKFLGSEGSIAFNVGILLVLIFIPRYLSFVALKFKRGAERS
mmetsp:Transcript_20811/g.23597  ORF Transcript_20811/g.23597 Transcript_20811/m.23597 type:complete len:754 (-) Transcript_20811:169-2430(-)